MSSKKNLLETTNWKDRGKSGGERPSHVRKPEKFADAIEIASNEDAALLEVAVRPGEGVKTTRAKQKARDFIDLVKGGLEPEDAAERIGMDLSEVTRISSATDMKQIVKETIETGHMAAEIRQTMMRAGANIALMNTLKDGNYRDFMAVYKGMASDPQIGLTGPAVQLGFQVNVGDEGLGGILKGFLQEETVEKVLDVEDENEL